MYHFKTFSFASAAVLGAAAVLIATLMVAGCRAATPAAPEPEPPPPTVAEPTTTESLLGTTWTWESGSYTDDEGERIVPTTVLTFTKSRYLQLNLRRHEDGTYHYWQQYGGWQVVTEDGREYIERTSFYGRDDMWFGPETDRRELVWANSDRTRFLLDDWRCIDFYEDDGMCGVHFESIEQVDVQPVDLIGTWACDSRWLACGLTLNADGTFVFGWAEPEDEEAGKSIAISGTYEHVSEEQFVILHVTETATVGHGEEVAAERMREYTDRSFRTAYMRFLEGPSDLGTRIIVSSMWDEQKFLADAVIEERAETDRRYYGLYWMELVKQ